MNFVGTGKKLTDEDLPRVGHAIGVGEDEIHAVLEVECRGSGFDKMKRPAMLFEPHVFYRELKDPKERARAVKQGLAYPKWRRNYPKDSYPRLDRALQINVEAALRSASWGLGQIMGFNHKLAGYRSAQEMVEAFKQGEGYQLEAMITFIKTAGLDDELRAHDWRGFARGYNGSGYAKHGYHTRLAKAFAKWQRIKDTPWEPEETLAVIKTPSGPDRQGFWVALINAIMEIFR